MATVASASGERGVSIGEILNRAFGAIGDNPLVIFGVAFLFGALPAQLFNYFFRYEAFAPGALDSMTIGISGFLVGLVLMFSGVVAHAAMVRATIDYADGEHASFGRAIGTGLVKALPLIGLTFLFVLGVAIGWVLLVVPGIMLMIRWIVASPALVNEDVGILAALGRSADLTKGARWKIFGLVLLLVVLFWILSILLGIVFLAFGMPAGVTSIGGPEPLWYVVVSTVSGTITSALWNTVVSSLYVSLSVWKEGPEVEALADVFA